MRSMLLPVRARTILLPDFPWRRSSASHVDLSFSICMTFRTAKLDAWRRCASAADGQRRKHDAFLAENG